MSFTVSKRGLDICDASRNIHLQSNACIFVYLKQTTVCFRNKSFSPFDNLWTTEWFFLMQKSSSLHVTHGALRGRKLYIITLKIKSAFEKSAFYRWVDNEAMWGLEVESSILRFRK